MAGIYIHIPFCKQACSYCNFHFSTSGKYRNEMVKAICREIGDRSNFFEGEAISSIYLGGGTPSILTQKELSAIFRTLDKHHDLSSLKEVTLEANPDDLKRNKLKELSSLPIDRLSIGIQSFHQEDLAFMNRAHTAEEAMNSVKRAQDIGFEKLNLDLIFGIPTADLTKWEANLKTIFSLNFEHLSAYALTLEEGTKFHHQVVKGELKECNEEEIAAQYRRLQDNINEQGWEQYELSNYARNGKYAIHNTAYWMNEKYLGIGPAAHSYNGIERKWNRANNQLYMKQLLSGNEYYNKEILSEKDRYHEALISRLRTKWGISKEFLESSFSEKTKHHFMVTAEKLKSYIEEDDFAYQIKRNYWFTSDNILEQLMLDD